MCFLFPLPVIFPSVIALTSFLSCIEHLSSPSLGTLVTWSCLPAHFAAPTLLNQTFPVCLSLVHWAGFQASLICHLFSEPSRFPPILCQRSSVPSICLAVHISSCIAFSLFAWMPERLWILSPESSRVLEDTVWSSGNICFNVRLSWNVTSCDLIWS